MSKKFKSQDELTTIAKTLPGEIEKITDLTRLANEALAELYCSNDWTQADKAKRQVQKCVKGLQTVANQMAVVNVALAEIAEKNYRETIATYEELLTGAGKREKDAYDRGIKDGRRQGETDGYRASQADYQAEAARLRAMFQ